MSMKDDGLWVDGCMDGWMDGWMDGCVWSSCDSGGPLVSENWYGRTTVVLLIQE